MLRTLSEKLKALRIYRPDEWTMDEFIRDAVKLEKERDEALAKLAAMEHEVKVSNQHLECYRKTYGSVPADNPVVAVKDVDLGQHQKDQYDIIINQPWVKSDFDRYAVKLALKINSDGIGLVDIYPAVVLANRIREMLAAAPSHIQQSAEPGVRMKPHLAGDESIHLMNCNRCGTPFDMRDLNAVMAHEGDRCPSHESEQGGAL